MAGQLNETDLLCSSVRSVGEAKGLTRRCPRAAIAKNYAALRQADPRIDRCLSSDWTMPMFQT